MAPNHMQCPRGHTTVYQRDDGSYRCKSCARADRVADPIYTQDDLVDTRNRIARRKQHDPQTLQNETTNST